MEGIALSALLGALTAGIGAYIVLGRDALTKKDHKSMCALTQAPIEKRFDALQRSQERTEVKVDGVSSKVDRVLGALDKLNGGGR